MPSTLLPIPPPTGTLLRAPDPEDPAHTHDRMLMARAQAGAVEAFTELYDLHAQRTFRMAYAVVHNRSTAEEIVQESFVRGLEKVKSYRGEAPPRAWLASITLNLCRHYLRDRKTSGARYAEDKNIEGARPLRRARTRGVFTQVSLRESSHLLAVALGYLTEAQREVVALRFEKGLSYEEIGDILDMQPGAARALVFRAKVTLKEKLGIEDDEGGI